MITKTAEQLLSKEAGLLRGLWKTRRWKTLPSAVKEIKDAILQGTFQSNSLVKRIGRGTVDSTKWSGRQLERAADWALRHPRVGFPAAIVGAVGLNKSIDDYEKYDYHIREPNYGITRIMPVTGNVRYLPHYRKQ